MSETGRRIAWYGKWPRDAYALGPFRYERALTEKEARGDMTAWASEPPTELWPAR